MIKLERAVQALRHSGRAPRCVILGGGVSANSRLRSEAAALGARHGLPVHLPAMAHCVDNAAMIAGLAYPRLVAGQADDLNLPAMATGS
jgi:N6-L-threonylcarbamoyladenine synthase